MAYENPPQDASPEHLLAVCGALTDGSRTVDQLSDDGELERSRTIIRDTVRYGVRLGFINRDDDENLGLTDRGWDIAFVEEIDESVEEPFRVGIQDYALYSDLIDKMIEEKLVEEGTHGQVTQKQILPLLNRSFGFSELSTENSLKPATNTFLQTLAAAGYGNFVVGRRDSPTRIELSDDFLDLSRENKDTGGGKDDDRESEITEEDEGHGKETQTEQEVEEGGQSYRTRQEFEKSVGGTDVNIEIQISSEDWTSEDVVQLIESIRSDEG